MNKTIKLETVDSTNDYIKRHLDELKDKTLVVSKIQTKGKGRSNRLWESVEGNLYMSLLLKDNNQSPFEHIVYSSVVIANTLESYNLKPYIKYPNDILIDSKKVSGILIERIVGDSTNVIIGIGLNVNQIDFGDLSDKATSMRQVNQIEYDLDELLSSFKAKYEELLSQDFDEVFLEYMSISYVLGRYYKGYRITGITRNGELVLNNNTEIKRVQMDEITLEELYDEQKNN